MPNEFIARNGVISRGNLIVSGSLVTTQPTTFSGSLTVDGNILLSGSRIIQPVTSSVNTKGPTLTLLGGLAGTSSGNGGDIVLKGGNGVNTGNTGGDVYIQGGDKTGSQRTGYIYIGAASGQYQIYLQGAPIFNWDGPNASNAVIFQRGGGTRFSIYDDINLNANYYFNSGANTINAVWNNWKTVLVKGSGATSSTTAFQVQNANASSSLVVKDNSTVIVGTGTPTTSSILGVYGNSTTESIDLEVYRDFSAISAYRTATLRLTTRNTTGNHGGQNIDFRHEGINSSPGVVTNARISNFSLDSGNGPGSFAISTTDTAPYGTTLRTKIAIDNYGNIQLSDATDAYVYLGNTYAYGPRTGKVFTVAGQGNTGYTGDHLIIRGGSPEGSNNLTGGNLILQGGYSRGTAGSDIILQVPIPSGSSGNVLNSTYRTAMFISGSGNIGINTSTPTSTLHVKGSTTVYASSSFKVENSTTSGSFKVTDTGKLFLAVNNPEGYTVPQAASSASMYIYEGPGNSGRAGITIHSGQSAGNGSFLHFFNYISHWASGIQHYSAGGGGIQKMRFYIGYDASTQLGDGGNVMTISSNGLGINTLAAEITANLQIKGYGATSSTTSLLVQNANASASLTVTDDRIVTANSKLYAGTFTPGANIAANHTIITNGVIFAGGGINVYPSVGAGHNPFTGWTSDGGPLYATVNGGTVLYMNYVGGGNSGTSLTISNGYNPGASTGTVYGVTHHPGFYPTADTSIDYISYSAQPAWQSTPYSSRLVGKVRGFYFGNGLYTSQSLIDVRAIDTDGGKIRFNGLVQNAISGSAYGVSITHTISASANSDTLTGVYIQPTFANGAYTGVNNYALRVSGSTYLYKSGSTVVDIQGSQGQLFSVIDVLSGSLMSVNDISGLPILEVFSDDRVVMGTYGAPGLTVSGSTAAVATGSSAPTGTAQEGTFKFAVVGGSYYIYAYIGGAWRSGSLS